MKPGISNKDFKNMKKRRRRSDRLVDFTGVSRKGLWRLVTIVGTFTLLVGVGKLWLEAADPVLTEYQDSVTRECIAQDHFDRKTDSTVRDHTCSSESDLKWYEHKEVVFVEKLPPLWE